MARMMDKKSNSPLSIFGWLAIFCFVSLPIGFLVARYNKQQVSKTPQTKQVTSQPTSVMGFPLPKKGEKLYADAIIEIYYRESRLGMDPKSKGGIIGPAGERGGFQVTPIWCRDIKRLFGEDVDPYDRHKLWGQIMKWLKHYGPKVGANSVNDLCELYRRGPTGYREWKKGTE